MQRNPDLGECFSEAESIATYIVSSVRKASDIRRLMKLAAAGERRNPSGCDCPSAGTDTWGTRQRVSETQGHPAVSRVRLVKEHGSIDLRAVDYQYGLGDTEVAELQIPVTPENVDDLFDATGRKIGDGLHKLYWRERVGLSAWLF